MKPSSLLLVLLSLISLPLVAAAPDKKALKEAERYEADRKRYITGHGEAATREEARDAALADIVAQIAVNVSSQNTLDVTEQVRADGTVESRSDFKATVRSYTTPTMLEGMETVWLTRTPPYQVVCAVERELVDDMLDRRRALVAQLCRDAVRAESDLQIDDALKMLYRAYTTLKTLPDAASLHKIVDGKTRHLDTWIPARMRDICQDVRFGIAEVAEGVADTDGGSSRQLNMTASYKGEPVRSIGVSFFDGIDRSGLVTFRNGVGVLELRPDAQLDPLVLDIEYRFDSENHVAGEMQQAMQAFNSGGLIGDAPHKVVSTGRRLKADRKETRQFEQQVKGGVDEGLDHLAKARVYENTMRSVVAALKAGRVGDAAGCFTQEAMAQFKKILSQGKASVIGKAAPDSYSFYPMGDKVVCRSVPMRFAFDRGRRVFTEDVNFTLDTEGKVENIAFGLGGMARDAIFAAGGDRWDDYTKMVIASFLENYRTAFALKDIDFIESVFDDNATIIIGRLQRTLEPTGQKDVRGLQSKEVYRYMQKSKDDYIRDLRKCFGANEYVNLRFYQADVEKIGLGGESYALQLRQDYTSQHYGDEGYLYLLVDFNEPERPLIKIRTWQPDRLPELTPNLPEDSPYYGIFSSGMF